MQVAGNDHRPSEGSGPGPAKCEHSLGGERPGTNLWQHACLSARQSRAAMGGGGSTITGWQTGVRHHQFYRPLTIGFPQAVRMPSRLEVLVHDLTPKKRVSMAVGKDSILPPGQTDL